MDILNDGIRLIHVIFGFIGLAAYWIPLFARKGAANHVRFGKLFVRSAYVVLAGAALSLSLTLLQLRSAGISMNDQPATYAFITFLAYLTYVTYLSVHHGMAVLKHKRDPAKVATPFNRALAYGAVAASIGIIAYALVLSPPNKILLFALSPIGIAGGLGSLRYMSRPPESPRAWFYEHMGSLLGSGIAFHTAFAVFGVTQLVDFGLNGWAAVIPWIAPTVIGVPATTIWTRYYRRKFGELRAAA